MICTYNYIFQLTIKSIITLIKCIKLLNQLGTWSSFLTRVCHFKVVQRLCRRSGTNCWGAIFASNHSMFLGEPKNIKYVLGSVQSLSHVQLFATPWTVARQASLPITNSQSLLKLMFIESVMPSNHLLFYHQLLLPPSIFSSIRVFSNESVVHISSPKYWSFNFSISPSNEYSGLISFRMDWLDLLVVQGTLKSLLQHHSSKPSILQHSAFFIVQLSYPYMINGKL